MIAKTKRILNWIGIGFGFFVALENY